MPVLTPEPLAFEEDWANRFAVVSSTLDPKQWIDPFYTGTSARCIYWTVSPSSHADVSAIVDPCNILQYKSPDDAVVKRAPLPPLVGKEAIKAAVNQMCSLVASISHR